MPSAASARRFAPELRDKLLRAMPGLKERAKTLVELLDSAAYLYAQRPLALDDKARAARRRWPGASARRRHRATLDARRRLDRADARSRGARLRRGERRSSSAQVAQPLRAALTGRATSPRLFDVMAVLGRDESLARMRDQVGDRAACIALRSAFRRA